MTRPGSKERFKLSFSLQGSLTSVSDEPCLQLCTESTAQVRSGRNAKFAILEDPESGQNEVNRAEIVAAKVFKKSGKSPLETSLSRPFPNASANAGC